MSRLVLTWMTIQPGQWWIHSVPVVGWMGTSGNVRYLSVAAEALRIVAKELAFELRLVVPDIHLLKEMDLSGVSLVHEPWQPANEVRQLQQFDVGLMPLFPNEKWAFISTD